MTSLDLDRSVLENWQEIDPDNWRTIAGELIDLFAQSSRPLLERIVAAEKSGDCEAMSQAAHALKSSCGNVGASVAFAICQKIEGDARKGASSEFAADVGSLVAAHARALEELSRFQRSLQAAAA